MIKEVELVNLCKKFGEFFAVDDLSLDIHKGEFVSLLGPSGCGKTTTLRMIAGLTEETSGQIKIRGEDVRELPVYERNIGMVFQDYALFPHLSILDNVAFGLRMRDVSKKEAYDRSKEMLALVKLPGVGERYPAQVSGGQQQRIALARALAPEPTVLLLDEPLSNLDLRLRQEMRVELKRIQREIGVTTIFVTHDQGEALSLADRVAVMDKGKIIQVGEPVELYERPNNKIVASFLGDANFFEGDVQDGFLVTPNTHLTNEEIRRQPNKHLTVIVRAEKIKILKDGAEEPNSVPGVIEASIYLGTIIRYYVRLADDKQIIVDEIQSDGGIFADGKEVILTWSETDCVVIKEEDKNE